MDKILSICIPTYNRKEKLSRLLNNIKDEIRGLEGEIEVCISDNGSDDGTADYLKTEWGNPNFELKFNFSEKNEGFDVNVLRATRMARGNYLWTLGDDDGVVKGSLKKLLAFLKSIRDDHVKVVYLNRTANEGVPGSQPRNGQAYSSSRELFTAPMSFMGFIVFRRAALEELDQNALERGRGTNYMHAWALRLISLANPGAKAIHFEFPACLTGTESEQSSTLRAQLVFSRAFFHQFWTLLWLNKSSSYFIRNYLSFTMKKLFFSAFSPFFEILCERSFRGRSKNRLGPTFFIQTFSVFGPIIYTYYLFLRIVPDFGASFLLGLMLWLLKTARLTRETDYAYWKKFWSKKNGSDFLRQDSSKVQ